MPLDPTNWKTPANIVANVIASRLPDTFQLGVNLFVGFMPAAVDNCIVVIDTGGGESDPVNAIDDFNFQLYSRNENYQTGYNLQNLAKAELVSITDAFDEDEVIIGIWVRSNIASLGRDESDRHLFSSNYRAKMNTQKDVNRQGERDVFVGGGDSSSI